MSKQPARGVLDHLIPPVRGAPLAPGRATLNAELRAAGQHLKAGRLEDVERLARRVLAAEPRNGDALDLLGVVAWKAGRLDSALEMFDRAIAGQKKNPNYHLHRGALLGAMGRFEDAVRSLRRAAQLDPSSTDAHYNLGLALNRLDDRDGAIAAYRQAVRCDPRNALAHNNLGALLMETGKHPEAEACFRRAIAIDASLVSAHNNLASTLLEQDRADEARAAAATSLKTQETALGHYAMGRIDEKGRDWEAARSHYERAIALDPAVAAARMNLGNVLKNLDRYVEALAITRETARLYPNEPGILNNLGLSLLDCAKLNLEWSESESYLEEARPVFERAIELDPTVADVRYNYATVLDDLGRDEDAITAVDGALTLRPDWESAHFLRGKLNLRNRRWDAGADAFYWYWRSPIREKKLRPFAQPWWDGRPLGKGERLLVWADQGIGDQIVNSWMIPRLGEAGIDALVECDPRLVDILRRSFGGVSVVAKETPPNPATAAPDLVRQGALSGLLKPLGPWPNGFPRFRRLFIPDPRRVGECKARLDAALGPGPKVGLSWVSKRHDRSLEGPKKSIELLGWEPILRLPGLAFVNLQYGDTDRDLIEVKERLGVPIHTDPGIDRYDDIEGLMALIEGLDLVITISNVTAHFAGAVGKDCWVMVRKAPFWYWGSSGERSPIYDSVRLYRQDKSGDWTPVIARVALDAARRLGGSSSRRPDPCP